MRTSRWLEPAPSSAASSTKSAIQCRTRASIRMQWRYFRGQRRLVPVPGGGIFNRTDDTGQYRITGLEPGDYMVMAVTRESWTDEKNPKERIGFLPTYAGGTASPADAMPVKVGLGQEVVMP